MTREEALRKEYPLHWAVFRNDYEDLMELLEDEHGDDFLNKVDVRGLWSCAFKYVILVAYTFVHSLISCFLEGGGWGRNG